MTNPEDFGEEQDVGPNVAAGISEAARRGAGFTCQLGDAEQRRP